VSTIKLNKTSGLNPKVTPRMVLNAVTKAKALAWENLTRIQDNPAEYDEYDHFNEGYYVALVVAYNNVQDLLTAPDGVKTAEDFLGVNLRTGRPKYLLIASTMLLNSPKTVTKIARFISS
jgi:hypothetical protein